METQIRYECPCSIIDYTCIVSGVTVRRAAVSAAVGDGSARCVDAACGAQVGVSVTRAMKYRPGPEAFTDEDARHLLTKVAERVLARPFRSRSHAVVGWHRNCAAWRKLPNGAARSARGITCRVLRLIGSRIAQRVRRSCMDGQCPPRVGSGPPPSPLPTHLTASPSPRAPGMSPVNAAAAQSMHVARVTRAVLTSLDPVLWTRCVVICTVCRRAGPAVMDCCGGVEPWCAAERWTTLFSRTRRTSKSRSSMTQYVLLLLLRGGGGGRRCTARSQARGAREQARLRASDAAFWRGLAPGGRPPRRGMG